MGEIFDFEKVIVLENGEIVSLKISGTDNGNSLRYSCLTNDTNKITIELDDEGNWIDIERGATFESKYIGELIEDFFD